MTVFETTIGGIILAIFTGLLGALLGNKNKVTEEEFNKHIKDSSPHIACPVHTTRLENIERSLDNIESKVDRLLER